MRIYWWNTGLHVEPDNQEEHNVLVGLQDVLKKAGKIEWGRNPDKEPKPSKYLAELLARNVANRNVRDEVQADDE